jgi:hypothetical protein
MTSGYIELSFSVVEVSRAVYVQNGMQNVQASSAKSLSNACR